MTTYQTEQLNKMLTKWSAASKEKYLFGMVAGMIKNSIQRVIDGKNTLQELEDALLNAQPKTQDYPSSYEYYITALEEVKTIIAGGELKP